MTESYEEGLTAITLTVLLHFIVLALSYRVAKADAHEPSTAYLSILYDCWNSLYFSISIGFFFGFCPLLSAHDIVSGPDLNFSQNVGGTVLKLESL